MNPWLWVEPHPEGAPVKDSIMKALTQHNPRVCLTEDDLEALNVLYPDCSHSISHPVCDKVAHNSAQPGLDPPTSGWWPIHGSLWPTELGLPR